MTEKQNTGETHLGIDPGYLMVLVYVLSVTALVLFGWFGAAGAHSENNTVPAETAAVLRSLNTTAQQ